MYEKFYIHKIAAVNLSKIYFLKNAKETIEKRLKKAMNLGGGQIRDFFVVTKCPFMYFLQTPVSF